jgi:hypothetical protein
LVERVEEAEQKYRPVRYLRSPALSDDDPDRAHCVTEGREIANGNTTPGRTVYRGEDGEAEGEY